MANSSEEPARGAGRPRDPRIEQAALAATRDLLAEVGYARLTLAAVAGRAGTTKAALYRRWPSLAHLVYEAAFPDELVVDVRLESDLRTDLAGIVAGTRDALTTPVAAAALAGLLAEFSTHPALHTALVARWSVAFDAVGDRLRRAAEAGEARPGARPEDLLRLLLGAVLLGVLLGPEELGDAWVERTTTLLLEGLRP
ncbi:TetR/AcrR family transcriptional regulator [Nocardioides antri]|uniref:TetR/AcrR family transcriptional regulator n=1 Tax=Nocardioides antri TaxID=2607659 RepID=A0A5B1M3I4_9ACTN|nr:TetR/AcrR family transcriptional regulator [Nocardioides antri]KAA1427291.1 TetR/AcrR family transcriptional regulator [Nocardioides antri]